MAKYKLTYDKTANQLSLASVVDRVWRKLRASEFDDWIWWTSILTLSWIAYHFSTSNLDLQIAWHGWGPLDYVSHKLKPENFHRDWIYGIKDNHYLWPMRTYYYLAKYFDISPFKVIYPFMAVQITCFVGAVAYLTNLLYSDRLASLLASCLAVVSSMVGLNLARFGDGLGMTVMSYAAPWGFALACVVLAFAQHLKQRIVWCFIYLTLAMYCHAGFALYALGFVGCWYLMHPRECLRKDFLMGLGLFILLILPTLSPLLHAAGSNSSVDPNLWFTLTKVFSYHSYPVAMKMFSERAYVEFVPFFIFTMLSLVLLRTLVNPLYKEKILLGYLGCLFASFIGVIFSDYVPSMLIIKLQPHRASALITLLGGVCLAGYLANLVKKADGGDLIVAGIFWVILLISRPGLSLIPLLFLLAADYYQSGNIFRLTSRKAQTIAGIVLLFLIVFAIYAVAAMYVIPAYLSKNAAESWLNYIFSNPEHTYDLFLKGGRFTVEAPVWIIGGFLLLVWLVRLAYRLTSGPRARAVLSVAVASVILFIPTLVMQHRADTWRSSYGKVASDYLKVQIWARNNTANDSLFLTDPNYAYGWRDFSERSSFGSAREWGFNALFYSVTPDRLAEGLLRLSYFVGDIARLPKEELARYSGINYSGTLTPKIEAKYCSLSDHDLVDINRHWGVNYVVFNKRQCKPLSHDLTISYENDSFVVYYLGG